MSCQHKITIENVQLFTQVDLFNSLKSLVYRFTVVRVQQQMVRTKHKAPRCTHPNFGMKTAVWTHWLLRIFWSLALICCWHNVNLDFYLGWFGWIPGLRYFYLFGDWLVAQCDRRTVYKPAEHFQEVDSISTPTRVSLRPCESKKKKKKSIRRSHAATWHLRLDFRGFVDKSLIEACLKCLQQHSILKPDVLRRTDFGSMQLTPVVKALRRMCTHLLLCHALGARRLN